MEYCYFRISGRVVYNYLWKKEESKGMITSELRRVVTLSVVEGNVTREEALGLLRLWFVESWSVFLFFELCIIDNFGVHFSNFLKLLFSYSVVCDSATPWTAARQASLSFTISWSLLNLMSIESVMPSNHLILCRPLLLLPSVFPSVRVFSSELALCLRWPKYCLDSWHLHFYFLLTFKNLWSEFYVKLSQLSCEGQAFAVFACSLSWKEDRAAPGGPELAGEVRGDCRRRMTGENDLGRTTEDLVLVRHLFWSFSISHSWEKWCLRRGWSSLYTVSPWGEVIPQGTCDLLLAGTLLQTRLPCLFPHKYFFGSNLLDLDLWRPVFYWKHCVTS